MIQDVTIRDIASVGGDWLATARLRHGYTPLDWLPLFATGGAPIETRIFRVNSYGRSTATAVQSSRDSSPATWAADRPRLSVRLSGWVPSTPFTERLQRTRCNFGSAMHYFKNLVAIVCGPQPNDYAGPEFLQRSNALRH